MSDFLWLVGLFVVMIIVRVTILAISVLLTDPGDANNTVKIDVMLNITVIVGTVISVRYGVFHPSITVFYGFLTEIVICWLIGFIPICMQTENHDVREMPSSLPKWLRP